MRYIQYQQAPIYNGTAYQSVPTIGSIGGYGYPNGYYYNQYFNPYYLRQQQEAQRRLEIQEANNQAAIWVELIKCRNNVFGYNESSQEIMEQIKERAAIQRQMNADDEFMNKIHEITQKSYQKQLEEKAIEENIERQRQVMSTQTSQNPKSFYQWLHEDGQERFMQSKYAELNRQQRDTSNLYDSSAYNQLLNTHDSVYNTYNSLNSNVSIEDMEIQVSLPERIRRERDIRRQRFAESIMKGMG